MPEEQHADSMEETAKILARRPGSDKNVAVITADGDYG